MIEGLQPLRMTGGQFVSLSWAIKSAVARLRDDYDYDFINGILGTAFMVQASPDEECKAWWTTGNQAVYLGFASRALGVPMRRIPEGFRYPQDLEAFLDEPDSFFSEHLEEPIAESLESGIPVIAQGCFGGFRAGQWSLIAGVSGDSFVGLPVMAEEYEATMDLPWQIIVLGEPGEEPDPVPFIREAFSHAVDLYENKAPSDPGWLTGKPAWDIIASALDQDPYCEACGPDSHSCLHWIISCAAGSCISAMHFTDMASEIMELSSPHLDRAMAMWSEALEALRPLT
ncbi:MAG: hypothetical protein ACPL68_03410, partial [Candidatus Hydrothermia bacterium]